MEARIYGVGTSQFRRAPDSTAAELVWQAAIEALKDAGTTRVDAVYYGTVFGEMGVAQRALHRLGITGVPIIRVENACASGTTAYHEAVWAVHGRRYDTVLVVGAEHMSSSAGRTVPLEPRDPEGATGLALPALYAMAAHRYAALYDVRPDQLAGVTVKNRAHAVGHPRTHFRSPVSVAEVQAAPMIADPFTRLHCSPISDGAAAVVVGRPRGDVSDVKVRASVLSSGQPWGERSGRVWGWQVVRDTAMVAWEAAGVGSDDVDLFEVHDAFTIGEIVTTEALGLAPEGEGIALLESGATTVGGSSPVNVSGGLLSRGHPLGATGVAQVAEVTRQLRGRAFGTQVARARIGCVETMGGGVSGIDGNACVVSLLERGAA